MKLDKDEFARTLVAGMPDAIVHAGEAGTIQVWNAGAARMFGFTEQEALGQSLDIIIPTNLRDRHWAGYRETMRTGRTQYDSGQTLSVPAIRKDGSRELSSFDHPTYQQQWQRLDEYVVDGKPRAPIVDIDVGKIVEIERGKQDRDRDNVKRITSVIVRRMWGRKRHVWFSSNVRSRPFFVGYNK